MNSDVELKKIIGLADACELLGALYRYPDQAIADAVKDGSIKEDAYSCLIDAGIEDAVAEDLTRSFYQPEHDNVMGSLRRCHSFLYERQGRGVPIFPYEGAYLHTSAGRPGSPALFRSPVALKVEGLMREVGVIPKDSRVEPCDSVWDEFEFLSFLLGSLAQFSLNGDAESYNKFKKVLATTNAEHIQKWLPRFFEDSLVLMTDLHDAQKIDDTAFVFCSDIVRYGQTVISLLSVLVESE